eukprot:scaffold1458_cov377-Prasinococcus_capsulatus_cf.AAC.5
MHSMVGSIVGRDRATPTPIVIPSRYGRSGSRRDTRAMPARVQGHVARPRVCGRAVPAYLISPSGPPASSTLPPQHERRGAAARQGTAGHAPRVVRSEGGVHVRHAALGADGRSASCQPACACIHSLHLRSPPAVAQSSSARPSLRCAALMRAGGADAASSRAGRRGAPRDPRPVAPAGWLPIDGASVAALAREWAGGAANRGPVRLGPGEIVTDAEMSRGPHTLALASALRRGRGSGPSGIDSAAYLADKE